MAIRDRLADAGQQVGSLWSSLLRWQQVSLVVAAVGVLGGILAASIIFGRTSYAPIFSGLDARDQAAVITYLDEGKIPYRTDSEANAILVPSSEVYKARIELSAKGIPSGGVIGFELLDNPRMGRTSFQEKVDYNRALEGELTRTIKEMSPVLSARVTIVVPNTHIFLEQQQPSTAAILLKLRPGASFSQAQARAVVHLISHSVEGLLPENVTLVDADGQISFNDLLDDSFGTLQSGNDIVLKQRKFEKDYEKDIQDKIKRMFQPVLGPNKVVAGVTVEMDFDKREYASRTVMTLPDKAYGPIQSVQNTEENYEGPPLAPGGIPGTTTNIPGYQLNTGEGQGNAEYSKTDNVTNYDNSSQELRETFTPGKVKRLSATVFIDGALGQRELDDYRTAVATAIMMDSGRGDGLTVLALPFDTSVADALAARIAAERRSRMMIGVGSFALFLLTLVGGLAYWMRRRRYLAGLEAARADEGGQTPSLRELLENPDLMTAQGELAVLEEQLRNYALNNPEELANLIKNWVVDDV
ncbi:MAG: flagellar M-ring protein FliF [Synergistaceae bacterium]|jgi:flagellar M-ring protein FliF|nr:flagellar M-ring protein FliF [Synergistaceae bacterium]